MKGNETFKVAVYGTLLGGRPVKGIGEAAPLVAHVQLHSAGLVEVVEGHLVAGGGFVHGLGRKVRGF